LQQSHEAAVFSALTLVMNITPEVAMAFFTRKELQHSYIQVTYLTWPHVTSGCSLRLKIYFEEANIHQSIKNWEKHTTKGFLKCF
jgi:hypothetical protein